MSKEKSPYIKPSFIYKAFITEKTMSDDIVSAVSYGELPQNVKYTISNIIEQ